MRATFRKLSTVIGMMFVAALVATSSAQAAPPPPGTVAPMRCIYEYNDNPNYGSEGWVDAPVAVYGGLFLGCGGPDSGTIHIAHPASNGTVHPVTSDNQQTFLQCFANIAQHGTERPDNWFPETRTRHEFTYYVDTPFGEISRTATAIEDNTFGFVYTVFTNTSSEYPKGNEWGDCALGIAST